jgi:hypothetical protein
VRQAAVDQQLRVVDQQHAAAVAEPALQLGRAVAGGHAAGQRAQR